MVVRIRSLGVASLLVIAACASGSESGKPGDPAGPGDPGGPDNPGDPGGPGGRSAPTTEQMAVSMGISIMSMDASGAPRLMRSFRPRASTVAVTTAAMATAAARDHLSALSSLWLRGAPAMALVSTGTQQLRNGGMLVKLAQHVGGVLVDEGEMHVLLRPDGSLAVVSGTMLPAMPSPMFLSSSREAVDRALDQQYGLQRPRPAVVDRGDDAGWQKIEVAADPNMRVADARARRVIAKDAGVLRPAWEVELSGDAAPDLQRDPGIPEPAARRLLIADASGKILSNADLIQHDAFLYRAYAEKLGNRRPLDSPLTDFSPHPTGLPDGSEPAGTVPSELVVMEAFNSTGDKWLPDDATTASGNNVEAFSDLDGSGTFTDGDVRPEVRGGRALDYHYDTDAEALATPDQLKAGAVNLFFLDNWMHDWWYESGFTEATGNAQVDNFDRGGVGGDPMIALAQAGALAGQRDNASMQTPADGRSPRMRIFVFTSIANTAVTTPLGTPQNAGFGNGPKSFELTGTLVAAVDGTEPTNDGCETITNDLTGKIAFVTFAGVCGSRVMVNNAKAAGAIGVLLADGTSEEPGGFGGSATANIPGLAIGKSDGAALAAALAAGPVVVTLSSQPHGVERDGALDSGVSGHEWAHYLHHRLAVCTTGQQCGGMSEGWGDFNGLLLQLRAGDDRNGTYAQGSYADFNGVPNNLYFSVRRFPYSRLHAKNPLSFKHIADENPLPTTAPGRPNGAPNSEVHNTGEVWALMLFEAFNLLIDDHGVQVARRRITDYSVAGLLLTPPEATFTEARDAILATAGALDSDDMLLIAAAFAGRGAGSCAVAPPNSVRTNNGVVESGTIAAKLQASVPTLTDDIVSHDHDGVLDPGESGNLRITLVNGGPLAAEDVTVTATTTNTGVKLGAPIRLPALQPFASVDLAIPVTLAATAPPNTALTITLRIVGQQTCDRAGLTVVFTTTTGTAIASSTADPGTMISHVEAAVDAPATSLRAIDDQVCITNDRP